MLPFGISALVVTPLAMMVGKKLGFQFATALSCLITFIGIVLMIWFHNGVAEAIVLNALSGLGLVMTSVTTTSLVAEITDKGHFGATTGAMFLFRFVGGATGPIIVTLVMNHDVSEFDNVEVFEPRAYRNAFIFMASIMGIALASATCLRDTFAFITTPKSATTLLSGK